MIFMFSSFPLRNTGTLFCQAIFFGHYGIAEMLAFLAMWRCGCFWQPITLLAEDAACPIPGTEAGEYRETRQACTVKRDRLSGGIPGLEAGWAGVGTRNYWIVGEPTFCYSTKSRIATTGHRNVVAFYQRRNGGRKRRLE
jgi:hypothetical protein